MKTINRYPIFFLILFFGAIYSFVAIIKHNHFQTGLDFGIYVQTFSSYINMRLPKVTFYPTYGDLVWSDHFTPSLLLLSPFYYLFSDPKILLILQSFLFAAGAYPIYLFSVDKTKNALFSYAIIMAYFLFFGSQYALTFDFHAATYSAVFLPWVFYTLFYKKWRWFILFSLLFAGAKEDTPLILGSIGLYLILSRRNIKLGLAVTLLSLVYLFIVTKYLMPLLSIFGAKTFSTPGLPTKLYEWVTVTFDSYTKIRTIILSLLSFAFLPIFSGWFIIIPFVHFFTNFISKDFTGRWDIYLHYRIHLASILAYASVLGYIKILAFKNIVRYKKILVYSIPAALFVIIVLLDFLLHLPLNTLLKPQFYQSEPWMTDNFSVIAKIPKNAYLLTQNNLAPHVANREFLYYFPKNIERADYIFLDLRKGQPIINFWLSGEEKEVRNEINHLVNRGVFEIFYQKGDAILLKKVQK